MADNINSDVDKTNSSMDKLLKTVKSLVGEFTKMGTAGKNALNGMGFGGFGQRGLGAGSANVMQNSFGSGSIPQILRSASMANMGFAAAQGGVRAVTGVVGGAFTAMPDVSMTTARSSAYYDASTMLGLGANGRNRLAQATFSSMKGGISELGYDAVTAGILTRQGVQFGAQGINSGQFSNLARSTANAAKYLNIDNASAAQAVGGLTQGSTSSSLMRNFGIYTTDPVTGRRLAPTEIFEQLNQRITGGQKLSRQDLMTSMQGGALSVNLQNSGLDATQQQLAYQYMLDKASGKKMDLGDDAVMADLAKSAGINPDQAKYTATTAQTGTMQAASDAYIEGMQKAAAVLEKFNGAMQGFLKSPAGNMMAQFNGGMNLAMGDNTVQGGLMAGAGLLGGAGMLGMAARQTSRTNKLLASAGLPVGKGAMKAAANLKPGSKLPKGYKWSGANIKGPDGKFVSKSAVAALSSGSTKLGKAVPILGSLLTVGSIINNASQGNWRGVWGDVGGVLGGVGATAAVTAATGGVGAFGAGLTYAGGSMAGNWAGTAAYDAFFGGSGGAYSTVASGSDSGTGALKLAHPIAQGAKITCKYNQHDANHPDGHKGIDYGVASGTTVMAAGDGEVIYAGGNGQNTYPNGSRTLGIQVHIKHAGGWVTKYGHLQSYSVSQGTKVKTGMIIGRSGNSGFSSGPHLHFELNNPGGQPADPSSALGGNYSEAFGSAAAVSDGSSAGAGSAEISAGGGAGMLGFSNTAKDLAGIKTPAPYSGGGTSAGTSGGSVRGSTVGHGASTTMTGGASVGNGQGGDSPARGNNITINVTVAQASESEARRFAQLIKQYIDDDAITSSMGRL